jgi:predicted dehydrogenase
MKKLRWALLGCGDIAQKRVAPALRDLENCEFVGVCREQADLALDFAKKFGAKKYYNSADELVGDSQIDAVYVATPVYLHAEHTVAAAEAKKHVLCEKPMALNLDECDEMITACQTNNVKLGIAYYRHFYPIIARVKQIIESGEIGKPVFVHINVFEYFNPLPGDRRHWFVEKDKSGGGPMFDFGCHRIEVLLNILGPVKSVKGFMSNVVFSIEVEDTATAHFTFDCGANAVLNVTRACFEPADTLDIYGDKGSIHIPVLNGAAMTVKTDSGERTEQHGPHSNVHQPLIDDFTQAVLDDRRPAVGPDIGKEVNRILERVYTETNSQK